MPKPAEMLGVSVRTIERYILNLKLILHVPLDIRCGKKIT